MKVVLERGLFGKKRSMGTLQLRLVTVNEGVSDEHEEAQWVVADTDGHVANVDSMTALAIILDGKGKG